MTVLNKLAIVLGSVSFAFITGCATAPHSQNSNASAASALPPDQWSEPDTNVTPKGNVSFHGPFCNQTLRTSWDHLPPHEFVRIDVTLLILRSWDGSVQLPLPEDKQGLGPDYFRASIADGPILLNTTFSNSPLAPGFYTESMTQNYPSPVPGDLLKPQTGADEANTLGYNFPWPGPPQLYPEDATYRLHFLVPHDSTLLTLKLRASGLSILQDESWGVTDVQVTPLQQSQVAQPSDKEIATAFATAIDGKSIHQPAAVNTLIAGMDSTVAWIGKNVKPLQIDGKAIQQAITDLSASDEHARDRSDASEALNDCGAPAEVALRDALRHANGELRARIESTLAYSGDRPITDENTRRVLLATRVLEVIGTPKALALRHALVNG